jgi:hypothetical protein
MAADRMSEGDQLAVLSQVHELLERHGIDYWLFGGWAVDFYAGSVTRAHDDVDLAVWLEDDDKIAELLGANGWRHAPEAGEDGYTGYERGPVRLELAFLACSEDGRSRPCGKVGPRGRTRRSGTTSPNWAACGQGSSASVRSKPTRRRFARTRAWLRKTVPTW